MKVHGCRSGFLFSEMHLRAIPESLPRRMVEFQISIHKFPHEELEPDDVEADDRDADYLYTDERDEDETDEDE